MSLPVSYHLNLAPNSGVQVLASFTSASDANAQLIAQTWCQLFGSTAYLVRIDSNLQLGAFSPQAPGTWVGSAAKVVGNFIAPTTPNGFYYRATVAGTTSGTQPTWPTQLGATVVDGGVTWICTGVLQGVAGVLSPY